MSTNIVTEMWYALIKVKAIIKLYPQLYSYDLLSHWSPIYPIGQKHRNVELLVGRQVEPFAHGLLSQTDTEAST